MLTDYFSPLTIPLLVFTMALFFFFDCLGNIINRIIVKADSTYRPVYWIFGLGSFVLLWFVLHFFLAFDSRLIWITILLPLVIIVKPYLKGKGPTGLLQFYKTNPVLVIILLIVLPALLIKGSLPPYLTDEVRYHFLSPFQLLNQQTWSFGTNSELYTYIPKTIDTFFSLVFGLTKTYAPARLFHYLIFFSEIAAIVAIVKKHFGGIVATLFGSMSLFLMKDVLIIATSGYTDYSVAGATALAVFALLDALLSRNIQTLLAVAAFSGFALGNKYTPLATFGAFSVSALGYFAISRKRFYRKIFPSKTIIVFLLVLFLSGGYWYLNNFIFTGNPIYPFLLPCKLSVCISTAGFFDGWTVPIRLANLPEISSQLLQHGMLVVFLIVSLFLIIVKAGKKEKMALLFLTAGVVIDLVATSFMSGFLLRYYLYLQIPLLFLIALPAGSKGLYRLILSLVVVYIVGSSLFNYYNPWRYLSPQEINYARQKTNLYQWINDRHTQNKDIIKFCADHGPQTLYILDQNIWHASSGEQFMSIFNINCVYASHPENLAKEFWFASTRACAEEPLVCISQKKGNNLYFYKP